MPVLFTHGGTTDCGYDLTATGETTKRGLPFTFPLSCTWAVYLTTAQNDHQQCFSYGPETFTGVDYYLCAILKDGGGVGIPVWSLGIDGDHASTAQTVANRWYYQAFRCKKEGGNITADFYYDLPDLTAFTTLTEANANYMNSPLATSHFQWGNDPWSSGAESLDGSLAGAKIWQAWLPVEDLLAESRSMWPVLPQWAHALWDCLPFRTDIDTSPKWINRINKRQWTRQGSTLPVTSPGLRAFQPSRTVWQYGDVFSAIKSPSSQITTKRSQFFSFFPVNP